MKKWKIDNSTAKIILVFCDADTTKGCSRQKKNHILVSYESYVLTG